MNRIKIKITFTALLLAMVQCCFSQKKEQKALFGEFMQVCNAYKQLPLYLNLGYKVSSNLPGARQDTATVTGDFYIGNNQAYIRFGAMEQVLTDTLVLVIMNDIKHIVAHRNNQPIAEQLKAVTGKPLSGQSLEHLLETCTIKKIRQDQETSQLVIETKKPVHEGLQPALTVTLTCNTKSGLPQKVVTTRRSLFKWVDAAGYGNIQKIEIPGKGAFGVQETTTVFIYNKIQHGNALEIPVTVNDRVIKGAETNLLPATGYEAYLVTEN